MSQETIRKEIRASNRDFSCSAGNRVFPSSVSWCSSTPTNVVMIAQVQDRHLRHLGAFTRAICIVYKKSHGREVWHTVDVDSAEINRYHQLLHHHEHIAIALLDYWEFLVFLNPRSWNWVYTSCVWRSFRGTNVPAVDKFEAKHARPLRDELVPHRVDTHKNVVGAIHYCESG